MAGLPEGRQQRAAFGAISRLTWSLAQSHARVNELGVLNSTDKRRAEEAKRIISVQPETYFDMPPPDSERISKFNRTLEANLARSTKRDAGHPGSSGGGPSRYRRRGRGQRRGGGSGSAPAHTAKWLVGPGGFRWAAPLCRRLRHESVQCATW